MTLRAKGYKICYLYRNSVDICLAVSVIDLYDHLNKFPRDISIFSKRHSRNSNTFVDATTASNLPIRFLHLRIHCPSFSQEDFSSSLDLKLRRYGFNSCSHVIGNNAFLGRSVVVETCRPSLESFKVEGKGVLSWWEASTIVNHHLVSCEHISCLEVSHLEISAL